MKILWLGDCCSDKALTEKGAPNQASARWSRGLVRGLMAGGCEIRAIDHCANQRWPRGNVFWQDADPKWFIDWCPCARIPYLNVVGFKDAWLNAAYARATKRVIREWYPDILLCYNSLHSCNVAAMKVARKMGVKCVPIILDGDDPRQDDWCKLLRDNRYADGVVFLSQWMVDNYPDRSIPIFHMDGGADSFKGLPPTPTPSPYTSSFPTPTPNNYTYTLVHTGALDYWRGLDFMKGVVRACKRQDVRFVFCGKCDTKAMWAEFDNDPRIEVRGFVSDEEVDAICRSADAFLSVREPKVADNVLNYPSKIPNYLAYGKPVVSTWVPSFSSDYRDILEVSDDTPEGFARKLDEVLAWDAEHRAAKFSQIKNWFESKKLWTVQARRLSDWLCRVVLIGKGCGVMQDELQG